jgi:hypothetical protein
MRKSIARIMVIFMMAVNFLPILSMGAAKEPRLPNRVRGIVSIWILTENPV